MKPRRLSFTLSILLFLLLNQTFAQTRFAVIGDYGYEGSNELAVANMIESWNVDFIITVGDNSYNPGSIDENIGQYYSNFIGNYNGAYGNGSPSNNFYPALGNHDYTDGGGLTAYFNYFTLPGNEYYYDFVRDNIHFFVINSITDVATQEAWLQTQMTNCTQNHNHWRIAYFHHPPYSSGNHGSTARMRWAFKNWGAHAILSGHDHNYERLNVDGLMYFVNGLGGRSKYSFGSPLPETQFRYNNDYGAQLVTVNGTEMKLEFYNRSGQLIDSYTITNAGLPLELLSATINTPTQVTLSFSKTLDSQSAQNEGNYNIDNGINLISAVLNSNNKDIILTTSAHNYNQLYTVTVNNVTDTEGNTISSQANSAQYLLEGDTTPPELLSAIINSLTEVELFFSEPLEMQSAQNVNNYIIDNGISVLNAVLNSNNKDVTLTTSAHNYNQQYTLTVSNVTDTEGNTISSQANSAQYLLEGDSTPPELLSANINSHTELKLSFSEPLEMQSAQNAGNYNIDNGISVSSAVLSGNNKDVTLTTSAHNYNQQYTVTVTNVTDLFGNTISSQSNSASYSYDSSGTGNLYKQYIVSAYANDWYLNYHPERSIDGIVSTTSDSRWAGAIPMPDSIIFDLGSPVRFSKTRISFYEWDFGRIYEYALKVSNDMVNWQTVRANTFSNTGQWSEETFNSVEGRYLLIISLSNNQSVWAGLWEAEIWGPDQATSVETSIETPTDYKLSQNYPNPLNPVTNISFSLPEDSRVRITLYNLLGEQVAELVNSYFASGTHTVSFDATNFTSGIYFYKMEAGEFIEIKKMTLMK